MTHSPSWITLRRRVAFTLGVLAVVRLGHLIPLPGLAPAFVADNWRVLPGVMRWSALGTGLIGRLSLFSLGLMPAVSAVLALTVAAALARGLRRVAGRRALRAPGAGHWVRILTFTFALFQSVGIADALQALPGLVPEPGPAFLVPAALSLTAGSLLMLWLADQVTVRGLGDGLLVILAADLLAMLPGSLTTAVQFVRQGLPMGEILPGLVAAPVQVLLIVLLRRARRHTVDDVGRPGRGALGGFGPIAPVCAYALVPSTSAGLDDRPVSACSPSANPCTSPWSPLLWWGPALPAWRAGRLRACLPWTATRSTGRHPVPPVRRRMPPCRLGSRCLEHLGSRSRAACRRP